MDYGNKKQLIAKYDQILCILQIIDDFISTGDDVKKDVAASNMLIRSVVLQIQDIILDTSPREVSSI